MQLAQADAESPRRETLRRRRMVAEDSAKHVASSTVVSAKVIENGIRPAVKNIRGEVDRSQKNNTLYWEYEEDGVVKFLIYRSDRKNPLALYKTIIGKNLQFIDYNIGMNTGYHYSVKAIFRNGEESKFSNEIYILY
jgi:hypothetical protein